MATGTTYYTARWCSADFQRGEALTTEQDFDALGEAVADAAAAYRGFTCPSKWEGVAAEGYAALLTIGRRVAAERGLDPAGRFSVGSAIRAGKQPAPNEMVASLAGSKGSTGGDWLDETGEE